MKYQVVAALSSVVAVLAVLAPCSEAHASGRASASLDEAPPQEEGAPATDVDRPARRAPPESDDDTDALRIGALGGFGFPRPLAIEALVKIDRVVALGLEYSLLPPLRIGAVETTYWALAADARLFPLRNGFFIGLRAGRQVLGASASVTAGSLGTFTESVRNETWFVNPRIGFLVTYKSGFTIGIDVGVQLPVSTKTTSTLPEGVPSEVDGAIASVAGTFGGDVTPTLDLLRIGFLF